MGGCDLATIRKGDVQWIYCWLFVVTGALGRRKCPVIPESKIGLKVLIHDSVTYIFGAIGVYHCFVIVISIVILCTYKFVDLGIVAIFGWGLAYVEWFILLLGLHVCALPPKGVKCSG